MIGTVSVSPATLSPDAYIPTIGPTLRIAKVGGMVSIRSRDGLRRVSIRPAFDALAVSMVPIRGWSAASRKAA